MNAFRGVSTVAVLLLLFFSQCYSQWSPPSDASVDVRSLRGLYMIQYVGLGPCRGMCQKQTSLNVLTLSDRVANLSRPSPRCWRFHAWNLLKTLTDCLQRLLTIGMYLSYNTRNSGTSGSLQLHSVDSKRPSPWMVRRVSGGSHVLQTAQGASYRAMKLAYQRGCSSSTARLQSSGLITWKLDYVYRRDGNAYSLLAQVCDSAS